MIGRFLIFGAIGLLAATLCVAGSPVPGCMMWHSLPVNMKVVGRVSAIAKAAVPQGGGQACEDDEGNEIRCPDGKYHDYYTGKAQPDSCDNFKTGKAEMHDCDCDRTKSCKHDAATGPKCKTTCRDKACNCVKDCS